MSAEKSAIRRDSGKRVMNVSKKQELKNYVVNSIVHNAFDPNELLRLINLLPDQPQLNENQQIVLEWLKEEKNNSNLTAFDCIYSFIYGNPEDLVTQNWAELNAKEEAQVLEAFGQWAQEQEEE